MHNHQVSLIPAMSSTGILGSCSWQGAVSIARAVPSQAQHPQPSPSFSPWLCPGGLTATAAWRQQPLNPGVYRALKATFFTPPFPANDACRVPRTAAQPLDLGDKTNTKL